MVVFDCDNESNRFPVEPFISGVKAGQFTFPISPNGVEFTGTIPVSIMHQFRRPCLFLEGGGYVTGRIRSRPALLLKKA
jgi:hypothetical protein